MREKLIYLLGTAGLLLLVRNLYAMFFQLSDEESQGAIWRIFYFHLPAALVSMTAFYIGAGASILYLVQKKPSVDRFAAAVNEIAMPFALMVLATGMIWARIIWGVWWAWDHRLTSYLICILLYFGYFLLRAAIDEPATRARLSAVLSIFAALDIVIVWKSIQWFRTQHPGPVLSIRDGGGMPPGWESLAYWNVLALGLIAVAFFLIRKRQEDVQHEIDTLRRYAHAL